MTAGRPTGLPAVALPGLRAAVPPASLLPRPPAFPPLCPRPSRCGATSPSVAGSDRVARRFGGVLTTRGRGPPDDGRGQLLDLPPGILLDPMIMPALGAAVTHTRSAARLVRDVVFEIALRSGPSAGRGGTRRVPDLGQVPQSDTRIVPPGLIPVVALVRGDRLERDDLVPLPSDPGGQP